MISTGRELILRDVHEKVGEKGEAVHQSASRLTEMSNTEVPQAIPISSGARKETCILCESALERILKWFDRYPFWNAGSYEVHRCSECGLEQTWPVPSLADLKTLYEAQYNFGGETGTLYTRWRERFLMSFLYVLWIRLDGDISFHSRDGSGRLLDVGCNEGRGLRSMQGTDFRQRDWSSTAGRNAGKGCRVQRVYLSTWRLYACSSVRL